MQVTSRGCYWTATPGLWSLLGSRVDKSAGCFSIPAPCAAPPLALSLDSHCKAHSLQLAPNNTPHVAAHAANTAQLGGWGSPLQIRFTLGNPCYLGQQSATMGMQPLVAACLLCLQTKPMSSRGLGEAPRRLRNQLLAQVEAWWWVRRPSRLDGPTACPLESDPRSGTHAGSRARPHTRVETLGPRHRAADVGWLGNTLVQQLVTRRFTGTLERRANPRCRGLTSNGPRPSTDTVSTRDKPYFRYRIDMYDTAQKFRFFRLPGVKPPPDPHM